MIRGRRGLNQLYGCNPKHTFMGVSPIEQNGAYFWVDRDKIVLQVCA